MTQHSKNVSNKSKFNFLSELWLSVETGNQLVFFFSFWGYKSRPYKNISCSYSCHSQNATHVNGIKKLSYPFHRCRT